MQKPTVVLDIETIARAAGSAIMAIYTAPDFAARADASVKGDDSPLTQADLQAHHAILEGLAALPDAELAGLPVLSEESALVDWSERRQWERYWLVDPLDGTKEFLKRNGEFTVNIALIENGVPILGVVYAPVLDAIYSGIHRQASWLNDSLLGTCHELRKPRPAGAVLRIVGSRSHQSADMQDFLAQLEQPYELVPMGSSLKICLIAEGKADLYPRLGLTSEWDTAAAHAVLLGCGLDMTELDGTPLRYNQKESLLNPYFIARS
ncbi:3'(2'),5'-bisphosphate nucleotidase [Pseudidiomarina aestuarii]|uniref:3'(2'),5'-bisphosphate nucleotidase CysQ n=1 Tax=Pseudidiomarina aestuarii TaxID=624146 RepID=A0A2T4D435_9GAMM|nr:3'(2'),5'-bisphosphate nucleotidase [Pseudidiomarina aestuarii]PTB83243.1 3'(2'),5'-bisphosphate nucleotidase [Pseudidiomarina aestuarii]PTB85051.1 3'(2'),5'-bisphosphate nucleotidase [Pseudidiomarina aestuarii]PTB88508.1 3'(2'),5'-bisphosphate nucleotidase [Pseudidiomarina aestuarii]